MLCHHPTCHQITFHTYCNSHRMLTCADLYCNNSFKRTEEQASLFCETHDLPACAVDGCEHPKASITVSYCNAHARVCDAFYCKARRCTSVSFCEDHSICTAPDCSSFISKSHNSCSRGTLFNRYWTEVRALRARHGPKAMHPLGEMPASLMYNSHGGRCHLHYCTRCKGPVDSWSGDPDNPLCDTCHKTCLHCKQFKDIYPCKKCVCSVSGCEVIRPNGGCCPWHICSLYGCRKLRQDSTLNTLSVWGPARYCEQHLNSCGPDCDSTAGNCPIHTCKVRDCTSNIQPRTRGDKHRKHRLFCEEHCTSMAKCTKKSCRRKVLLLRTYRPAIWNLLVLMQPHRPIRAQSWHLHRMKSS